MPKTKRSAVRNEAAAVNSGGPSEIVKTLYARYPPRSINAAAAPFITPLIIFFNLSLISRDEDIEGLEYNVNAMFSEKISG